MRSADKGSYKKGGHPMANRIKFTVNLLGATRKDEQAGVFVSFCPALNIYSQGVTEEDAHKALQETIELYLETCYEHGILRAELKKSGFVSTREPMLQPKQACEEFIKIEKANFDHVFEMDIPWNLVAAAQEHDANTNARCS